MKPATPLPFGRYRLTHDVKNPRSDRRKRYDWRAEAVWKAETEFFVSQDTWTVEGFTFHRIVPVKCRWAASQALVIRNDDAQTNAIVEALERVGDDTEEKSKLQVEREKVAKLAEALRHIAGANRANAATAERMRQIAEAALREIGEIGDSIGGRADG